MLNNGICAICKTNKWTILCPECSRPLCSDCMKDLDGCHRCERCLNKDVNYRDGEHRGLDVSVVPVILL